MPYRRFVREDGTRLARMINAAVALLEILTRSRDAEEDVTAITSRALRAYVFQRLAEVGVPHDVPEEGEPARGDLRAWSDCIGGHGLRLHTATVAKERAVTLSAKTEVTCERFLEDPEGFRPDGVITDVSQIPVSPEPELEPVGGPEELLDGDLMDELSLEAEEHHAA